MSTKAELEHENDALRKALRSAHSRQARAVADAVARERDAMRAYAHRNDELLDQHMQRIRELQATIHTLLDAVFGDREIPAHEPWGPAARTAGPREVAA